MSKRGKKEEDRKKNTGKSGASHHRRGATRSGSDREDDLGKCAITLPKKIRARTVKRTVGRKMTLVDAVAILRDERDLFPGLIEETPELRELVNRYLDEEVTA